MKLSPVAATPTPPSATNRAENETTIEPDGLLNTRLILESSMKPLVCPTQLLRERRREPHRIHPIVAAGYRRSRPCGALRSWIGPAGTIPVGLMPRCVR